MAITGAVKKALKKNANNGQTRLSLVKKSNLSGMDEHSNA